MVELLERKYTPTSEPITMYPKKTIATYIDALEQLFVITDIDAWS